MFEGYNFKNYGFRLLILACALNLVGILTINSAEGGAMTYTARQLLGVFAGLLIAVGLSLVNYHYLLRFSGMIYSSCVVLLLAVILSGQLGGGSRRWIEFPVIGRFQPSEFVKIGLILFFAWYLQKNQERINQPRTLAVTAALGALPILMIMRQPDLSTSIVTIFIVLSLIFVSGISYRVILTGAAVTVPCLGILGFLALKGLVPFIRSYQINRILAFLNPQATEQYQTLNLQQDNSKMAIGSGGLYGKGLFQDSPLSVKNGNFLSEEHTDFIFSIIGEELGFIGCVLVLLLFLLFVLECLRLANRAEDLSGRLLCTGMAALVGFQSFTNIAVVTGIFPNTGLTLPFISYGVSSLVSLYIGLGVILNVALQQRTVEI